MCQTCHGLRVKSSDQRTLTWQKSLKNLRKLWNIIQAPKVLKLWCSHLISAQVITMMVKCLQDAFHI